MSRDKIVYFAGCAVDFNEPEVGKATIEILEKNGKTPIFTEQKCCGATKLYYGKPNLFRSYAEFNVRSLGESGCDIVTGCPSCALILKQEYPAALKNRSADAVSQKTFDIFEYLAFLKKQSALNMDFQPVNCRVSYFAPCHLRAQGENLIDSRLEILSLIAGLSIEVVGNGCCGMGGTFGMKSSNYKMSMEIGKSLFEEINSLETDLVATDCLGCKLQIQHGAGIEVIHPILLLRKAYGL
jgi:glycerol-3-phosphate dehydrogenase subunit C